MADPVAPGELLRSYLDKHGITQTELAGRIGCATSKVNDVIQGKRGITAAFALSLGEALGNDPKVWLKAQMEFDLAEAKKKLAQS